MQDGNRTCGAGLQMPSDSSGSLVVRLTAALNEVLPVRCGAAAALGKPGTGRYQPLIGALADPKPRCGSRPRRPLRRLARDNGSLIQFLKYTGGDRRIDVVRALGQLHASDAIEPLVQILEKADDRERQEIADALDEILTAEVRPVVTGYGTGITIITKKYTDREG